MLKNGASIITRTILAITAVSAASVPIERAAAEGLGTACLSLSVVGDLMASGRLNQVRTTLPRMLRQCYLVMHRGK